MSDNEEEVIAAGDDDADTDADAPSDLAANKERQDFIKKSKADAKSELELALYAELESKDEQIARLTKEILKLQGFVSKRKQQYKRKRKDGKAPTRALSAYNIFVKERFSRLAKQNQEALKSNDVDTSLERIPPATLVASSGSLWKDLSKEEKAYYEEKAKADQKRYQEEMANYQPPEKTQQRKRNKTGYNMFFSAHVTEMKRTEEGVPSERGSVARLVGNAWKNLSADEKEYYEKLAEEENGNNPIATKEEEAVAKPSWATRTVWKVVRRGPNQMPRPPPQLPPPRPLPPPPHLPWTTVRITTTGTTRATSLDMITVSMVIMTIAIIRVATTSTLRANTNSRSRDVGLPGIGATRWT